MTLKEIEDILREIPGASEEDRQEGGISGVAEEKRGDVAYLYGYSFRLHSPTSDPNIDPYALGWGVMPTEEIARNWKQGWRDANGDES